MVSSLQGRPADADELRCLSQQRPGGRDHFQAPCAADNQNLVWLQPQPAALQRAAAQHHLLMPAAARPQLASGPAAPAVGHKALAAKEARLLGGAPVGQVGHEVVEFPVGRRLRFGYVPQRLRPAGAPDLSLASCRGTHKGGQDVQIAAVDMKFLSCSSARCCALACINPFD